MSPEALFVSGLTIITIPTIQFGGTFLLSQLGTRAAGYADNPLRRGMFTAGHAHAGVLVLLALIVQPLIDQSGLQGAVAWLVRFAFPAAAILISAGFFLSVASPTATKPGPLLRLVYVGATILAVALLVVGVSLVVSSGVFA
ncbi:MAG: hypothetical protein SF123_04825 [Chloroflexota bacterium]|nr:hypothetical protein [Chloroflexota bacterium]